MSAVEVPTITVYARDGCHLCEDAVAELERIGRDHAFLLEVVDIETDDELHRRYLERIPVICLEGEEISDFFVDERALRERFSRLP